MTRKYFGTDGVRGKVGEYPITPDFVMKLGWAAGKVLSKKGTKKVLIGKDTRISGYMLESALEAGLSAAGLKAILMGPMPTPAVAYLTRTFRAEAGIVISASHNPYYDNGIKFFSADGTKLPDEVELAIEAELDHELKCVESAELGKAQRIDDAAGRYIEFCKSTFPTHLSLEGVKMVVDCGHGATYHIAPSVFRELGAEVIAIGCSPDGLNINDGVGSTAPEALAAKVLECKADLGVAFDGDGDRLVMVDSTGYIIDGDEILYIIARDALRNGRLKGGVVGTLMANMGLELALQNTDGGLWDWDLVGGGIVLDDSWRRALGYEESECSSDFSSWLPLLHPDDLAITRHLGAFLSRQRGATAELEGFAQPAGEASFLHPTAVLFNGGVLKSGLVAERLLGMLNRWLAAEGAAPARLLGGTDLDLAVARGAAYYGYVRRGRGVRIRGGTAQAYYVAVESAMPAIPGMEPPVQALCLAPFGMEEGSDAALPPQQFGLVVGEPVRFRFFGSSVRRHDQVGTLLDFWAPDELQELEEIEASLPAEGRRAGDIVPVHLHARITETGTLQLEALPVGGSERWKVEFDVRGQA